jgi:hypothetical protein
MTGKKYPMFQKHNMIREHSMSFEERNSLIGIVTDLLVIGLFVWQITTQTAAGAFDGPDAYAAWARLVLTMIVVSIAASIVVTILINIALRLITGQKMPPHLVDERDRQIRLRGAQVTLLLTSGVFLGGVGLPAANFSVFAALNVMLSAFAVGTLTGSLTKFALQRGWV